MNWKEGKGLKRPVSEGGCEKGLGGKNLDNGFILGRLCVVLCVACRKSQSVSHAKIKNESCDPSLVALQTCQAPNIPSFA